MSQDEIELVEEYFNTIDRRLVNFIKASDIKKSCAATLLLIFAAMDGLGKLLHKDTDAGPGPRFKHFLALMGANYRENEDSIWNLRNELVHNLLNGFFGN